MGGAFGAFGPVSRPLGDLRGPSWRGGSSAPTSLGTGWRMIFLINVPRRCDRAARGRSASCPESISPRRVKLDLVGGRPDQRSLVLHHLTRSCRAASRAWPPLDLRDPRCGDRADGARSCWQSGERARNAADRAVAAAEPRRSRTGSRSPWSSSPAFGGVTPGALALHPARVALLAAARRPDDGADLARRGPSVAGSSFAPDPEVRSQGAFRRGLLVTLPAMAGLALTVPAHRVRHLGLGPLAPSLFRVRHSGSAGSSGRCSTSSSRACRSTRVGSASGTLTAIPAARQLARRRACSRRSSFSASTNGPLHARAPWCARR